MRTQYTIEQPSFLSERYRIRFSSRLYASLLTVVGVLGLSTVSTPASTTQQRHTLTTTSVAATSAVGPSSPELDTARRFTSSLSGGALAQISAGAVIGITWYCVNYATGGACPPITSNWSTGYVPPGFGDYFSSPTTFASGGDTQVIFVSPATPPGSYTLEACLSNAYTGGSNDCVSFVVNVTSSVPPQLTTVMPGFSIKLEDAIPFTPGSHPMPIPTQGHLYLQIYINGAPTSALQAGPSVGDPTPKLVIQPYNQFPLSDPSFDVTAYVTQSCLYAGYNTYLFDQNFEPNHAVVPNYNVGLLNSNSWTDGLLLSCGVEQTTINTWVSDYFAATGRNPTAYQNGNQLLPYFTVVRRHPSIHVGS